MLMRPAATLQGTLPLVLLFVTAAARSQQNPCTGYPPGRVDQNKTEGLFEAGKALELAIKDRSRPRREVEGLANTLKTKAEVAAARIANQSEFSLVDREKMGATFGSLVATAREVREFTGSSSSDLETKSLKMALAAFADADRFYAGAASECEPFNLTGFASEKPRVARTLRLKDGGAVEITFGTKERSDCTKVKDVALSASIGGSSPFQNQDEREDFAARGIAPEANLLLVTAESDERLDGIAYRCSATREEGRK
jgi:hypothetical protein